MPRVGISKPREDKNDVLDEPQMCAKLRKKHVVNDVKSFFFFIIAILSMRLRRIVPDKGSYNLCMSANESYNLRV